MKKLPTLLIGKTLRASSALFPALNEEHQWYFGESFSWEYTALPGQCPAHPPTYVHARRMY